MAPEFWRECGYASTKVSIYFSIPELNKILRVNVQTSHGGAMSAEEKETYPQLSVFICVMLVGSIILAACSADGTMPIGRIPAPDATRTVSAEIQKLLPEVYRSEDGRLSFRYPSGWVFDSKTPEAVSLKLRLANGSDGLSGKPGQVAIEFVDPVFVMEMAAMLESSGASLLDVLRAYATAAAGQKAIQNAGEPQEVNLSDRSALIWEIPAADFDLMYLAAKGGDGTIYVVKAAVSKGELDNFLPAFLAIAETSNFIAPAREQLDAPALAVRSYLEFVVQHPDWDEALNYMCLQQRTNMQLMIEMFRFLVGNTTDFDPDLLDDLMRAYLAFGAARLETDVSHLYYDTVTATDNVALVNVMGNLMTSSGPAGERRIVPFHQFVNRNQYRLVKESGQWLLCES